MKEASSRIYFIIAIILVIIDQLTKITIKGFNIFGIEHQGMMLGESIPVIGDFLRITFVENEGMAFGIKFGAGKIFLSLFSIIASVALGVFLNKLRNYSIYAKLPIMLIFSGAIGNLIDRVFYGVFYGESAIFYGKVVDFIQVDIPDITIFGLTYTHWPVFNVADSCVTLGVLLMIFFHNKMPALKEVFSTQKIEQDIQANPSKDNH